MEPEGGIYVPQKAENTIKVCVNERQRGQRTSGFAGAPDYTKVRDWWTKNR